MDYKNTIKNVFALLAQKDGFKKEEIARYFHADYQQYVDGKHLDYEGFVAHLSLQQEVVDNMDIVFKTIVQEGNTVFTNHEVCIKKKDGKQIKVHVIAEFLFQDGKVILCDELTHLVSGSDEDRDIGSRK